jgi:hypothetical protein
MIVIPATLYWNMQANILPKCHSGVSIDAARAHLPLDCRKVPPKRKSQTHESSYEDEPRR